MNPQQRHELGGQRTGRFALTVILVGLVVVGTIAWVRAFGPPRSVLRLTGTGGYGQHTAGGAPHRFTFDAPKLWTFDDQQLDSAGTYSVFVQGPSDGIRFVQIYIKVRAGTTLGGKYGTLEQFASASLPSEQNSKRQLVADASSAIARLEARDVAYTYNFIGVSPPGILVPSRGRALLFEDRGYFYMLEYSAPEADYDQYSEVFDRAVASFRFLD